MRLEDLLLEKKSDEAKTVKHVKPPGSMGEFITSAQAAKILGVSMSRIRQLVGDGTLRARKPEHGRRDHIFRMADVNAVKTKEKDKGGRPKKDSPKKKKSKKS